LQGLGLTVNQTQQQSAIPPGQVVGTIPPANTRVLPNSTVTVIVATPILVSIPFVVNQTIADARAILTNAGLQVSAPNVPNCGSILFTCRVSTQTPGAGVQVPRGSTVTLTLSVTIFSRPTP
jgi:serine/threonine-protein kinase